MAALPYIQLYVADYLADTMHLTAEEHGAYLLIIMNYWQTGRPIPKNRLPSIAKIANGRWTDVEQTLNEFFSEDENGCWVHARIEADLTRVKAKSIKASRAGKASAAKRAASQPTEDKEDSNERSSGVELGGNHTEADTDNIKHTNGDRFDSWWDLYPKKNKKKTAKGIWVRRKLDTLADKLIEDTKTRMTKDRRWVEGFVPDPTTYLNGDRWEDDLEVAKPKVPDFWALAKQHKIMPWCEKYNISTIGKSDSELVNRVKSAWEAETGEG